MSYNHKCPDCGEFNFRYDDELWGSGDFPLSGPSKPVTCKDCGALYRLLSDEDPNPELLLPSAVATGCDDVTTLPGLCFQYPDGRRQALESGITPCADETVGDALVRKADACGAIIVVVTAAASSRK